MGPETAHTFTKNTKNGSDFCTLLQRYHKDVNEFLSHITWVTGDETWVSFVNVETKEQSMQWIHIHQISRKVYTNVVCEKSDGDRFAGHERSADGDLMQRGTTMSDVYCETLKKLHRTIWTKRHGMLTYGVVLLYDNAHPHSGTHARTLLEHLKWEVYDHPPYSPNHTLSNYHLITYLKNWLRSQCCNNN
jgi:preprotein translocase subunit SecE